MDSNEHKSTLLAFVRELLHSRSPDWSVSVRAHEDGGYIVEANHPASHGVIWELGPKPIDEATRTVQRFIESDDEVAVASAAPTLSNARLIGGIRTVIEAFDWSNDEVRGLAGVLWDARVIRLEEAGWLAGYCGADAPRQYHAFE